MASATAFRDIVRETASVGQPRDLGGLTARQIEESVLRIAGSSSGDAASSKALSKRISDALGRPVLHQHASKGITVLGKCSSLVEVGKLADVFELAGGICTAREQGVAPWDFKFKTALGFILNDSRMGDVVSELDGSDLLLIRLIGSMAGLSNSQTANDLGLFSSGYGGGGTKTAILHSIGLSKRPEVRALGLSSIDIFLAAGIISHMRQSDDHGYSVDGRFYPCVGADRRHEIARYPHEYSVDYTTAFTQREDHILKLAQRVREHATGPAIASAERPDNSVILESVFDRLPLADFPSSLDRMSEQLLQIAVADEGRRTRLARDIESRFTRKRDLIQHGS
ncbi:MAG: hypothetical protein ABIH11_01975 [Candidatus Altiarchaeota archaeon]